MEYLLQIVSVFTLGMILIYTVSIKRTKMFESISFLCLFLLIYIATNNSLFLLLISGELIGIVRVAKGILSKKIL